MQGEDSGALGISWGGGRAKDKGSQVIIASHRQRPRTVQEGVARHGIPASRNAPLTVPSDLVAEDQSVDRE